MVTVSRDRRVVRSRTERDDTMSFKAAVDAWVDAIGRANVVVDRATRRAYETATSGTTQRIAAVLRPGSFAETRSCVRIAHRHRVPIHTISQGKNWGYGCRVPVED